MQDAGYETSAIEMDADCCRFLRDVVRIPVRETDDPAGALAEGGPYDVIAMWHVIEHLPNPREVLTAAAAALAPGGVIALAAPNPEAFQFRVFGRRWTHLDAPRHLFLVPLDEYARVGAALGLEVALATTRDEGTLHWNAFGWRETFAGFGRGRYARGGMRVIGSAVTRAAAPIERRGRQGATYTLILRRPALRGGHPRDGQLVVAGSAGAALEEVTDLGRDSLAHRQHGHVDDDPGEGADERVHVAHQQRRGAGEAGDDHDEQRRHSDPGHVGAEQRDEQPDGQGRLGDCGGDSPRPGPGRP